MLEIEQLRRDFNITDDDVQRREALDQFLHSFASLLVDEFYTLYLKNDPELKRYLKQTDGSLLLKKLKEFIIFLFSAPLDARYIERIEMVGMVHFSIKLPPARVSYAFLSMRELISKMAEVNLEVKNSRTLIMKFFAMAEFVIKHSYYGHEKRHMQSEESGHRVMGVFEELYGALHLHHGNYLKVAQTFDGTMTLEKLRSCVSGDSERCSMGRMLGQIDAKRDLLQQFGIDLDGINTLHRQWHDAFNKFCETDDRGIQATTMNTMKQISEDLERLIDKPLEKYGNESLMVLSSGIKAMRSMMELFYFKSVAGTETRLEALLQQLKERFVVYFSWGIEQFEMDLEALDSEVFDLYRNISVGDKALYIGIRFKEQMEHSYLSEMLILLLEAMEMNFSIAERERSLMAFADRAETANRSKDIFLANMSHELRTPLNAITGFSQILLMRPDTPESVKNYVEKINIAGTNLLDLVNTILDFAKLESGKMQFNPQLSSLKSIVDQVHTLVSTQAQKKSIRITVPTIQSLNLLLDPNLIKQVLVNLMSNAIKFTPEGGEVTLALRYSENEKAYVFSVCDSGVGISEADQAKLFKPFSQVENVYQKEQKGTGLGLMISKKIVEELHKGRIWVESTLGEGSCFYVKLPIPALESHTYQVQEAEGTRQLLLVEDSAPHQQMIIDHLKHLYNFTVTDTVNRAKELLVSNRYDFIVLDFFLIDGISSEVLQFMEEEHIDVPSIVISAEDDINIAKSLSGFSNLQSILSKDDINHICSILKNVK